VGLNRRFRPHIRNYLQEAMILKRLSFVFISVFLMVSLYLVKPVWALSDGDYKKMLSNSREFAAADARLNKTWKSLVKATPKNTLVEYRKAQVSWNKTVRDELVRRIEAVEKAKEYYPDAPLGPVLKKGKFDRGLAYAKVTEERAIFLEELVKQTLDKKYISSFKGTLDFSHGAYIFHPEGWWSDFIFCWASMSENVTGFDDVSKILESAGEPVKVKVSGRLYGGLSDGEENVFGFDCENEIDTLKVELF
jgi:uncharacterized protein YecT (DUF1311 family)